MRTTSFLKGPPPQENNISCDVLLIYYKYRNVLLSRIIDFICECKCAEPCQPLTDGHVLNFH